MLVACDKYRDSGGGTTGSSDPHESPAATSATAAEIVTAEAPAAPATPAVRTLPKIPVVAPAPVIDDPARAGECPKGSKRSLGVMTSPARPFVGGDVHVLAATFDGDAPLHVRIEHEGAVVPVEVKRRHGAPNSAAVRFQPTSPGSYRVVIGRDGEGLACRKFRVASRRPRLRTPTPVEGVASGSVPGTWETRRSWKPREEALYSAWVRELFHAPRGAPLAFEALEDALRDAGRNPLFDSLGLGEDDPESGLSLKPDCADTPYFLRAYFAWKRRLPFLYHKCSRGTKRAPVCRDTGSNESTMSFPPSWVARAETVGTVEVVNRFFRRSIGWGVHSGNGRVGYEDSVGDFYPVALETAAVRPGSIYADPYGHLFVVVEWMSQEGGRPGVLYAIDGQPDGSITRKRFWAGNFLWNPDPSLGGSGFKRFAPVVRGELEPPALATDSDTEAAPVAPLVRLENAAIARKRGYRDYDPSVGALSKEAFFDRMDALISPAPVDASNALVEVVDALAEAAKVRLTSVNNGLEYVRAHPDAPVEMPWGHDVFETVGPWENFSTPARDLRLLVAMDVVTGFIDRVVRSRARFGIPEDFSEAELRASLQDMRGRLLSDPARAITYIRSDGSKVTLTMEALLERATALEVAYNPNDCAEVRWGAAKGTSEYATCARRAPEDQQKKMAAYREWFRSRRRPRRGTDGPDVPGVPRPDGDD